MLILQTDIRVKILNGSRTDIGVIVDGMDGDRTPMGWPGGDAVRIGIGNIVFTTLVEACHVAYCAHQRPTEVCRLNVYLNKKRIII